MKRKTVLVSGSFNVLHPGHLRLLRFAKSCGDYLIVAVNSDRLAASEASVRQNLRLEVIASNSYVDETLLLNEPITDLIARLKPAIVVKGKEYETRENVELLAVQEYGGILLFGSGEHGFSSLDLLHHEFLHTNVSSIHLPKDFMARHNITKARLESCVQGFEELKVCVVGDLIVDEYITCQAIGMSQEEPTLVVTPVDNTSFIGGAAIVAAHAAGLGASVKLVSVTGNDLAANFARTALGNAGVESHLIVDGSRPTTLKQRFRSGGKSLLRVNHLHQRSISLALQHQLLESLRPMFAQIDLLVFSDFNYGCLPQKLITPLVELAKSHRVLMAADSQSSSQMGDISRFKDMDLITPTEREARISTRNHEDGLVVLAEQLLQSSGAKNILLKIGAEGVFIHSQPIDNGTEDKIAALNSAPQDVAGAGDSLLIASAMALASGSNIWESACIGSIAAAVQVSRIGNTPLKARDLMNLLQISA